ncbi:MAG: D-inositol 3-phosphate glycosyltransferase [Chloroflexi bacterium ADurb.Bin180]|nr:MAG: D-inositol 3-phosphate glycosyltransferase [Chloroflexi bacterium ADurb.Bin180]HOU22922.1 glycosyltransferase family 1 protein [Anaerolineae bacterium]HQJ51152.1 glycosyltransferase family 1 protein [Anaerolineae bacterium]
MRIGIDARLVFYRQAGISQYTVRLLEELAQVDPAVQYVVLQSRKDQTRLADRPNLLRRSLWTPPHHRAEQLLLPLELATLDLDVLHSPDFIPPFRRNCKSVITIHDLNFLMYPHFLTPESARYYGQIDQAVRSCDHIIAVSECTKRDVIRLTGAQENKITVVYEAAHPLYRPLNDPAFSAEVKRRNGLERDFVLFVSTIEPRKNVPTLLMAFRQLLDDYRPEVDLVLGGEKGWLFEEVFALVDKLQLKDRVRFVGKVTPEDLLGLYNAAKILVHPAFYEGFGLPPLEAMACGTPVVVSNTSSLPEVVGDAALLVDPSDVEGLTVAMWRVLSDATLRKKMIDKGLKRARQFSWRKAAEETLEVYRRLAGERPTHQQRGPSTPTPDSGTVRT